MFTTDYHTLIYIYLSCFIY